MSSMWRLAFVEFRHCRVDAPDQVVELAGMALAVLAVKRKDVLDLRQRHAHRLAAQDQAQAHPVAPRVGAAAVDAARSQQALVFVEADRAQRDAVFARQLGDAVERVIGCGRWRAAGGIHGAILASAMSHAR
jgi:Tfp pilus assembly PilM family ATPase